MRQIFSSPDSAETGLAQSRLEAAGIACKVRNGAASQAIPGIPFVTELWVLHYQDYEHARRLLSLGLANSNRP
jgi:Putative prokaryotic signal transducing protein